MRHLLALLAALGVLATLAAGASAAISASPPAPPLPGPGLQQNLSPWNCNGKTFSASGLPIMLRFGWGALSRQNMVSFFQNESGNVAITGTDTFSDSWGATGGTPPTSADGIPWTAVAPAPLMRPDGTPVSGYGSQYQAILAFAPGTYTLTVNIAVAHPITDGFGTYKGTLTGTCTFTVGP